MIATIQLSLGYKSVAKNPVDCNSHLLANNASLGKIYNVKNLQSAGWSVVSQFLVQQISSCIAMEALQKNYKVWGIDLGFYQ